MKITYVKRELVRMETDEYGGLIAVLACGHREQRNKPTRLYPEAKKHRKMQNCWQCTKALMETGGK
jgi:hypothetical protein